MRNIIHVHASDIFWMYGHRDESRMTAAEIFASDGYYMTVLSFVDGLAGAW